MKKVFIPFCFVALAAFGCNGAMSFAELPSYAQVFIQEYFQDFEISYIQKEENSIEVKLGNGILIEFDLKGRWKSLKSENGLMSDILPVQMQEYLLENYGDLDIIEIERESNGFEVKLQNGKELFFNLSGNYIEIMEN